MGSWLEFRCDLMHLLLFLIFATWLALGFDGIRRGREHSEPLTFWVGVGLLVLGAAGEVILYLTTH